MDNEEYQNVKEETDAGFNIFQELRMSLPSYLENLLQRSGFDSLETVKLINREVVDEVEAFARCVFFSHF